MVIFSHNGHIFVNSMSLLVADFSSVMTVLKMSPILML